MIHSWAELLWGKRAKFTYLLIASAVLLLAFLGSRDIWTQEHRWADIVSGMFFRQDFLHPYLNDVNYYDKPLLSYWLMAGTSFITGLSAWALRLPSALAGIVAIWSIYRLGCILKDKRLGLLSGWMLLTSFYFIFWARTSSADMLNMAGALFAVYWYFDKKTQPSFFNYAIFFLILAVTSLCKGLGGAIIPLIAIFPDLIMKKEWKRHLRLSVLPALVPAAVIYFIPFWASAHFGGEEYGQSGLTLVYQENILRYFHPFDHKGPLYTYFIYLPIYLLPWTLFFIPALISLKARWKAMSTESKWMVWAVVLLFLFFTVSGSRRNYYVLPIVPFAILMTADWILASTQEFAKRNRLAGKMAIVFLGVFFLSFGVLQPFYYAQGGTQGFADKLKTEVTKQKPWNEWTFVMLDPESKTRFYLGLSPQVKNYGMGGRPRNQLTAEKVFQVWPILKDKNKNTIFITRKMYEPMLKKVLADFDVVDAGPSFGERLLKIENKNAPIAFVPRI